MPLQYITHALPDDSTRAVIRDATGQPQIAVFHGSWCEPVFGRWVASSDAPWLPLSEESAGLLNLLLDPHGGLAAMKAQQLQSEVQLAQLRTECADRLDTLTERVVALEHRLAEYSVPPVTVFPRPEDVEFLRAEFAKKGRSELTRESLESLRQVMPPRAPPNSALPLLNRVEQADREALREQLHGPGAENYIIERPDTTLQPVTEVDPDTAAIVSMIRAMRQEVEG